MKIYAHWVEAKEERVEEEVKKNAKWRRNLQRKKLNIENAFLP